MSRDVVAVTVPAKVNLHLGVGPLRPDGFHHLVTVFQAVSLVDEVTVSRRAAGSGLTVSVTPAGTDLDISDVPADPTNLAAQAALAVADFAGEDADGLHVAIRKGIPVAGGMAGGSADAAAALVAVDALLQANAGREELENLAAELGSDVNFALHGGTAIGTGRGEQITPVLARGTYHWAFAFMPGGLSAGAVYRRADELRGTAQVPEPSVPNALLAALATGDPAQVGPHLHNDLEAAAVAMRPELDMLLELGRDYGALGALVSGSGPTCAFLAKDAEHALDLAVSLSASGLCSGVRTGRGPVAGARISDAIPGPDPAGPTGGPDGPQPPELHSV